MNYSNMIEEKGLKKGFIIATLVSTIVGTFTTSLNFYDRVQEKKNSKRQQGVDDGQNKQIQDLKAQVEKIESKQSSKKESRSSSRSRSSSGDRRRRRRRSVGYDEDQDFRRMANRSRRMIEREYDENYLRLGQRYAQGDVVTENKLQAQIIMLQQAVINVLQDTLMEGRSLSQADIHRLIAAQNTAREGSLEALRGQYDRLLPQSYAPKQFRIEAPPNGKFITRQLTLPAPEHEDFSPPTRVQSMPVHSAADSLFCRYAISLQDPYISLSPVFRSTDTRGGRCPDCGIRLPVSTQDVWTFDVRTPMNDGIVERRTYEMDARMVVKSHTTYGDYACTICSRERDLDCVCRSVEGLIEHMGRDHTSAEFERERDMFRV